MLKGGQVEEVGVLLSRGERLANSFLFFSSFVLSLIHISIQTLGLCALDV